MCTDFRYSHEDLAIFGDLTPHVRVEIPVKMALNAFTTFERRKTHTRLRNKTTNIFFDIDFM